MLVVDFLETVQPPGHHAGLDTFGGDPISSFTLATEDYEEASS